MRVLFFGDSITQGFYDLKGGWVQRLANHYHGESLKGMLTKPGYDTTEVFNLGISGDTAQDVLARMENETKVRIWPKDITLVVVAVGVNDARQYKNRAEVDEYDFQKTIEKLISTATKIADKVLFVGVSAVNEQQTNPWPFSSRKAQWSNNRINLFEDIVKQCAGISKTSFVPIHDRFLAQLEAGEKLLSDGLHPNEAGHVLIAELVKPYIDKLLIAQSIKS